MIDAHMHLIRRKNFDADVYKRLDMLLPNDTELDDLVGWMKKAGISKAVAMGQDQTRIWNTTFGDDFRAVLGAGGVNQRGRGVDVAVGHVDARIVASGDSERVVERAP